MGRLKSFDIVLSRDNLVYNPGERIEGKCVIANRGSIKLRCVSIYMRGIAKVQWTESRSTGTRLGPTTEHFNSEVEYCCKKIILFGNDSQDNPIRYTLPEGEHEFQFSFELPVERIPSSFEGINGNIRYWLKAEVEKPWGFNHKTKKAFTVINPIDINQPKYLRPAEKSVEKTLCCWLCTSGPISITARTDRQGFCAGESVAISADFENHSSRTIIPYASLHQNQSFYANGKTRRRTTKFTVLTGLPVSAGSRATWDAQLLKIPAVSPSILNCFIIKVEYFIKLSLNIPGSYNLSLGIPIVVGTVPFRRSTSPHFLLRPPSYEELIPFTQGPPTYVESIEGAVSIREDDDDEDCSYTPMYVYVNNYQPPAYSRDDPNPFPAVAAALNLTSTVTRL